MWNVVHTNANHEAQVAKFLALHDVEVYVGHLRNKLDRPFGRSSIATIRGAGYRLEADGG